MGISVRAITPPSLYQGKDRKYLGTFKDRNSAAITYDRAALEAHGAGAALNYPTGHISPPTLSGVHSQSAVVSAERVVQGGRPCNGFVAPGGADANVAHSLTPLGATVVSNEDGHR
jgi:hypothetical protein